MNAKITYRQQYTRCGKARCRKCKEGSGHGPYWYAYWSENGRTISKYIGTQLPEPAEKEHIHANGSGKSTSTPGIEVPQEASTLKIYLLGQFRIERKQGFEWITVDGRAWHRRRARALLGCLLSSPNRRLGREQIMDQLWPDLDIDVAANRLNGAVHELRQILEPDLDRPASSRLLRLERDMLELADSRHIWVDAEAFEGLLKEADVRSDPALRKKLLEEAAALYRGSYLLEELYSEWAAQRRDALQRAWIGLLLTLSQVQAEYGEFVSALETLDRLRSADPSNETALQRLMILLTQRDRRGEALQIYRQHKEMLQKEYESEPLPETIALFEKLRLGHVPAQQGSLKGENAETTKASPPTNKRKVHLQQANEPAEQASLIFNRPVFQLGRHNQSPLIGREHELEHLRQMMLTVEETSSTQQMESPTRTFLSTSPAQHRKPHFILLRGETGIGKTRLAEELSLEAYQRKWTVAWSRSYEQESSIPYHPWAELLRTFFQSTSPLTPPSQQSHASMNIATERETDPHTIPFKFARLRALLPDVSPHLKEQPSSPPRSIPYEQERLHLWEAAFALIDAISQIHPLLLVLDDLHWADESSIELLIYLIHHFQDQPVLIIGTCREGELAPQNKLRSLIADLQREQAITIIAVQPLTNSQIETMVSYLPQAIVKSIQSQAAGNPFFAEELARYVSIPNSDSEMTSFAGATIEPNASRTNNTLPDTVAAVLERRLSRLSDECLTLLRKAAVIGGSFELRQLLPLTGEQDEDTILDLLEEALQAKLLIEEGTGAQIIYHFWHPLIISHLYNHLSAARRAQLHRKIAESIQKTTTQPEKAATAIVYHLNRGGGNASTVAYYTEIAANQAYALSAYAEAQQYYLQVLQVLAKGELYITTSTNLHEHIQQVLTKDFSQLPIANPLHTCRILERIAECSMILGNFAEGRELYQYILRLRTSEPFQRYLASTTHNPDEQNRQEAQIQALLWCGIGNTWASTGEYASAYECYKHGKEVMSCAGITSGAAWASLHLQYGSMLRIDGQYHEARRYLQEALSMLAQSIPQDPPPAMRDLPPTWIERVLAGDLREIAYAHERLGIVAGSLGEVDNALIHMHTALTIYESNDLVSEMARVCGNLGAVNIMRGDLQAARMHAHRALTLAKRGGELPKMTSIMLNLGDIAQRSGKLHEAETWFEQSLEMAERVHDRERISRACSALASVQQDLGNLQAAATNIGRAIQTGRTIKNARCTHYALVGLAELRISQAQLIQYADQPYEATLSQAQIIRRHQLLHQAKTTLQRASTLTSMEVEALVTGKQLLALVHYLQGDLEAASCIAQQTLQDAQKHEAPRILSQSYGLLARINAAQGNTIEASSFFQKARYTTQRYELRLDHARILYHYGCYLLQSKASLATLQATEVPREQSIISYHQQALHYLRQAEQIFHDCQAAIDLRNVQQVISWATARGVMSEQVIPDAQGMK